MKWLGIACVLCTGALLLTAYCQLRASFDVAVPATAGTGSPAGQAVPPVSDRRASLAAARRSCNATALDRFIDEQRAVLRGAADDPAALRLLAEALLERIVLRNQRRGMRVGEPLDPEVPPAAARDIEDALDLLQRARALGTTVADDHRLEAALLGNRITGLGSALQWNGRIESALAAAAALDDRLPQLHVTLGLRRLLAPPLFGHDPADALQHFEYAATAMPDDERPRVFAAMAAFLLQRRQRAVEWLEQAVAVNPNNVFARAVLARVRRDEPDPFARDVSDVEVAGK